MTISATRCVLTATCDDVAGIVAAVTSYLADRDGFLIESKQFSDPDTRRFFHRLVFNCVGPRYGSLEELRSGFSGLANRFGMEWSMTDAATRPVP